LEHVKSLQEYVLCLGSHKSQGLLTAQKEAVQQFVRFLLRSTSVSGGSNRGYYIYVLVFC